MADNTANFAALKAATLGADAIKAPKSTLGASQAPELAKLYQSTFQLPQSNAGAVAAGGIANDIVAAQKAAAAKAAKLAEQKKADLSDPTKYRRIPKADGGYDFFAPDGSQIDIATLTTLTKTKPGDWVADSQNPIDIQYVEESKNLNDYIQAKLSNNQKAYAPYEEANPELKAYQGKGGIDKLIQAFKERYQRYYTPRSTNPTAWGVTPSDNPLVPSAGIDPYAVGDGSGIGQ